MYFNSFIKIICSKNKNYKKTQKQSDNKKSNILVQQFLSAISIKIKDGKMIFQDNNECDREFFKEIEEMFVHYLNMTDEEYKNLENQIDSYVKVINGTQQVVIDNNNIHIMEVILEKYFVFLTFYFTLNRMSWTIEKLSPTECIRFMEKYNYGTNKILIFESYKKFKNLNSTNLKKSTKELIEISRLLFQFMKNFYNHRRNNNYQMDVTLDLIAKMNIDESETLESQSVLSLSKYRKKYQNILKEDSVRSIAFKFLLRGKEKDFDKFYDAIERNEPMGIFQIQDMILNLMPIYYSGGVMFPKDSINAIKEFINDSIDIIIKNNLIKKREIVLLKMLYQDYYEVSDFVVCYRGSIDQFLEKNKLHSKFLILISTDILCLMNIIEKSLENNRKIIENKKNDNTEFINEIEGIKQLGESALSNLTKKERKNNEDLEIETINLQIRYEMIRFSYYIALFGFMSFNNMNESSKIDIKQDIDIFEEFCNLTKEFQDLYSFMQKEYNIDDVVFKNFDSLSSEKKSSFFQNLFKLLDIHNEISHIYLQVTSIDLGLTRKDMEYLTKEFDKSFNVYKNVLTIYQWNIKLSKNHLIRILGASQDNVNEIYQRIQEYYKSPRKYINFTEKSEN